MLAEGGVVGLPWGPCTAAQGAPLTTGGRLGLGSVLLGELSSVSSLSAESPEQGPVWSQQGLPPGVPKREAPPSPTVWAVSTAPAPGFSEGLGGPWVDPH